MFCKKCGNQIQENSKFCKKCGQIQTLHGSVSTPKIQNIDGGKRKAFYDISYGQLIAVSVFGGIGWLATIFSMNSYEDNGFATFLLVLIPFVVVFYVIGWRKNNNL